MLSAAPSRSVLAEIHASFPGELTEHSEQTHTNITWLAASQNRTEVVLFLLEQASRVGWTLPPGLLAVSCSIVSNVLASLCAS